jgi:putative oxidoreductase
MRQWVFGPGVSWGLLPLRLVVGAVFVAHGGQKLFVFGLGGTAGFMAQIGIPAPGLAAVVVTFVELLGGLALALGLLTRLASLLLAIDMVVAVVVVHLPAGFFLPRGSEFALTLLGATVTLLLTGPGALALDRAWGTADRSGGSKS